jgi:hypothetical protein
VLVSCLLLVVAYWLVLAPDWRASLPVVVASLRLSGVSCHLLVVEYLLWAVAIFFPSSVPRSACFAKLNLTKSCLLQRLYGDTY